MNYYGILSASCLDFKGWSTVLQVCGCSHGCDGCFSASAQNPKAGNLFTEDTYQELSEYLSKPYINNLVIQGGEITYKRNIQDGLDLCHRIKRDFPDKDIIIFTGYTLLEIQSDSELSKFFEVCDYIVDGKFVKELSGEPKAQFRGSRNQCIYHIVDGIPIIDPRFVIK